MEFLMRDDVNLSAEQWQSIDSAVIQAARNVLVGRKFLQIYGPLGAGAQSVNVDVLTPAEKGSVDLGGRRIITKHTAQRLTLERRVAGPQLTEGQVIVKFDGP